MSAYIVSKTTMDHVVGAVDSARNRRCRAWAFGNLPTETPEQLTQLGRALYDMNLDAVLQRYPRDTRDTAPGPIDITDIHDGYRYARNLVSREQRLKSVQCLLYQCSEGDVPETSPLYTALEALQTAIACEIVGELPAYANAVWDA